MEIITSHLPVLPQRDLADNSKNTSEYSTTVSHNLIFSTELLIPTKQAFLIILSLYNTNRFERQ